MSAPDVGHTPRMVDLPQDERMLLRAILEAEGGHIAGYDGAGVLVALPNPPERFRQAVASMFTLDGGLWYFPLGTDNPPAGLRHDASYAGSRGFWCYGRFVPKV